MNNTVCTLYELNNGEDSEGTGKINVVTAAMSLLHNSREVPHQAFKDSAPPSTFKVLR